ncbi:MAG: hypothetical protein V4739_09560 [Pseudomonadota bacterium]
MPSSSKAIQPFTVAKGRFDPVTPTQASAPDPALAVMQATLHGALSIPAPGRPTVRLLRTVPRDAAGFAADAAAGARHVAEVQAAVGNGPVSAEVLKSAEIGVQEAMAAARNAQRRAANARHAADDDMGDEALEATAVDAEAHSADAIDSAVQAKLSWAELQLSARANAVADIRGSALRTQQALITALDRAADLIEADGGDPETVAMLRNDLQQSDGEFWSRTEFNSATERLDDAAVRAELAGLHDTATSLRAVQRIASADFTVARMLERAENGLEAFARDTERRINAASDRLADLPPRGALAQRATLLNRVEQDGFNADMDRALEPSPQVVESFESLAEDEALVAGFLSDDSEGVGTAEHATQRLAVDRAAELAADIGEQNALLSEAEGGARPNLAFMERLYQRLDDEVSAVMPGLQARVQADASAAAANPASARLRDIARRSASLLDRLVDARASSQASLLDVRSHVVDERATQARASAGDAHRMAQESVNGFADTLEGAGAPSATVQALRGLVGADSDALAASDPQVARSAFHAARTALGDVADPALRVHLTRVLTLVSNTLTAARQCAGHAAAVIRLATPTESVTEGLGAAGTGGQPRGALSISALFETSQREFPAAQGEASAAAMAFESTTAWASEAPGPVAPAPPPSQNNAAPPPPAALEEAGTAGARQSRGAIEAAVDTHGATDPAAVNAGAEAALQAESTTLAERILAHPQVASALKAGGKVLTAAAVAVLVAQLARAIRTDLKNGDATGGATRLVLAELVGGVVGAEIGAAGGAAAGAYTGAVLGSVVPGLGTAAGAVVGSAVGAFVGGVLGFGAGSVLGGQAEDRVAALVSGLLAQRHPGALGHLNAESDANALRLMKAGSTDDAQLNAAELRHGLESLGCTVSVDNDALGRLIDAYSSAGNGALSATDLAHALRDKALLRAADGSVSVDPYLYSLNLGDGEASQVAPARHIASRLIHLDTAEHEGAGDGRVNARELMQSFETAGYTLSSDADEGTFKRLLSAYDPGGEGAVGAKQLEQALLDGACVIDIDGSVSINTSRILGQSGAQAAHIALRLVRHDGGDGDTLLDAEALVQGLRAMGCDPDLSGEEIEALMARYGRGDERIGQPGLQAAIEAGALVLDADGGVRYASPPA